MRHALDRRTFLQAAALGLTGARLSAGPTEGELLPNGIRLPSPWPPRRAYSLEPMPLPYLDKPPAVIPIDVGRQLFVDDFLIAETTLTRTYHAAKYHADRAGPPARSAWEKEGGPAWRWCSATASGTTPRTASSRCGTWAA